jgi:hypothetical protein
MGIIGSILGALGGISGILFIVEVVRAGSDPLISSKLGAMFWLYLAILLFLGAIVSFISRNRSAVD